MHRVVTPVRHVFRKLVNAPLFAIMTVLTLALAIGGNTAVFSIVNGVLLKPLPYQDPERLVGLWHTAPGMGLDQVVQSPALHFTYCEENQTFADLGMWDDRSLTVTGLEQPERVAGVLMSRGVFPTLGIAPYLGRVFSAADEDPQGEPTVILGHSYWQSHFGGDPGVIGTSLTVDGVARTIIGVLPGGRRFMETDAELFMPFRFDLNQVYFGNFSYRALARLKPGVDIERANQDVARMIPMALERFPAPAGFSIEKIREARLGPALQPLKQEVVGDVGNILWVLLGTVGMVLLIACANVANLFLVRAEARHQELAVRSALGASRRQIGAAFLYESCVLGVMGGVVGLAIAWGGVQLLTMMGPEHLPRLREVAIDPAVVVFNFAVSILTGVLFGLVPALRLGAGNMVVALKEVGRGGSAGRSRLLTRSALVIFQVAIALVLLVASGLMIRSFRALRNVEPGFSGPAEVQTLRVSIPAGAVDGAVEVVATYEAILRRLERVAGVDAVGASSHIPLEGSSSMDPVFVQEFPTEGARIPELRRYEWVMPGHHQALGVPLLAGRHLSWSDLHGRARVVVISEDLAGAYWDSPAAALGKLVRESPGSPWREVVGVVGNVHADGIDAAATPTIYWPALVEQFWGNETWSRRSMGFVIRSPRAGTSSLQDDIRRAVWSVNANLPLANVFTLDAILDRSLARTSFSLVMLSIAAVVALLLGVVGIYGVIAYTVSLRTRELGVRMALGAQRWEVTAMIVRRGLVLTAIGVAAGIGAAVGLTRLMAALLFEVTTTDPLTFAAAAAGLVTAALAACLVPARRAAGVNPIEALRWE